MIELLLVLVGLLLPANLVIAIATYKFHKMNPEQRKLWVTYFHNLIRWLD